MNQQLREAEVARRKAIAKDKFLPLLIANTESLEDAEVFCQAISIAVKTAFNNQMRTMKVGDLKLVDMLDQKNERYEKYKAAFELFNDEPIVAFNEIVDGMPNAIQDALRGEAKKRTLDSLNIEI